MPPSRLARQRRRHEQGRSIPDLRPEQDVRRSGPPVLQDLVRRVRSLGGRTLQRRECFPLSLEKGGVTCKEKRLDGWMDGWLIPFRLSRVQPISSVLAPTSKHTSTGSATRAPARAAAAGSSGRSLTATTSTSSSSRGRSRARMRARLTRLARAARGAARAAARGSGLDASASPDCSWFPLVDRLGAIWEDQDMVRVRLRRCTSSPMKTRWRRICSIVCAWHTLSHDLNDLYTSQILLRCCLIQFLGCSRLWICIADICRVQLLLVSLQTCFRPACLF